MRSWLWKGMLGAVVALPALSGAASSLHAQECSDADLIGVYSFVTSGTFGTEPGITIPIPAPFAAVGQTTYHGDGNANGFIQFDFNGMVLPPGERGTWTATYTVEPSTCLVTKIITIDPTNSGFGPLTGAKLTFLITAGSEFRELRFLLTKPSPDGTAVTGTARKQ